MPEVTEEDCCRSCRVSRFSYEGVQVRAVGDRSACAVASNPPWAVVEKCSEEIHLSRRVRLPNNGKR